jgi:hydroxymethylglutaryl-CoA lyase
MPDTHNRIRITEVAPRDGLQNEPQPIAASDKIALIRALLTTGVDEVEVSSFVSARWVPQLGDASEVFAGIASLKPASMILSALVPNERGLDAALDVNARAGSRLIDKVSVFTSASETFSARNTNASISETLVRFQPVITRAHAAGLLVRGYVSCIIACPFEGPIHSDAVSDVSARLLDLGVDELDLGDTIGAADPTAIARLLDTITRRLGDRLTTAASSPALVLHLHDTFGRAADCAVEAFRRGVRSFDGAVAGLGGCPYASTPARRAPGNVDTDLLVRALTAAGATSVVDLPRLADAAAIARRIVTPRGASA